MSLTSPLTASTTTAGTGSGVKDKLVMGDVKRRSPICIGIEQTNSVQGVREQASVS